jgi:hypothetical protein
MIVGVVCFALVAVIAIGSAVRSALKDRAEKQRADEERAASSSAAFAGQYRDPLKGLLPVCVPANIYNQSWEHPPHGGKMEAFRNAVEKTIRDISENDPTHDHSIQYRISDVFDSFVPGTTAPRDLVTFLPVKRMYVCPDGSVEYTLDINH